MMFLLFSKLQKFRILFSVVFFFYTFFSPKCNCRQFSHQNRNGNERVYLFIHYVYYIDLSRLKQENDTPHFTVLWLKTKL